MKRLVGYDAAVSMSEGAGRSRRLPGAAADYWRAKVPEQAGLRT